MEQAKPYIDDAIVKVRAAYEVVSKHVIEFRDGALQRAGVWPEDLQKLSAIPMICSAVALLVNITLLLAMSNYAWIKATALSGGQPFTAYLSLTSVKFGTPLAPSSDNGFFCKTTGDSCELGLLCSAPDNPAAYPNSLPKNTPAEAWCTAAKAGATAMSLLWLGLLPGLAACGFTFLYGAKDIPNLMPLIIKVEDLGFTPRLQKLIIVGCWGVLWLFLFFSMSVYSAMIPDTLGWGLVEVCTLLQWCTALFSLSRSLLAFFLSLSLAQLEASFGLLRFGFILISIFGAILASYLFSLWSHEVIIEAYMEFQVHNALHRERERRILFLIASHH